MTLYFQSRGLRPASSLKASVRFRQKHDYEPKLHLIKVRFLKPHRFRLSNVRVSKFISNILLSVAIYNKLRFHKKRRSYHFVDGISCTDYNLICDFFSEITFTLCRSLQKDFLSEISGLRFGRYGRHFSPSHSQPQDHTAK